MFTRRLSGQFAAIAALGTFLLIAKESRADDKIYHGTMCVQRGDITPEIQYGFSGAVNMAASAKTWVCPVARDWLSGNVTDWDIVVNRVGANTAWDIGLYSCDTSGGSCYWDTVTVPANPSDGLISLDGGSLSSFSSQGGMYVYTSVPAGAHIYSYHVDEGAGVD